MSSEATPLDVAYKTLVGGSSPFESSSRMALKIIENWSDEVLGDRNAIATLCYIILFVRFENPREEAFVFRNAFTYLKEILGFEVIRKEVSIVNAMLVLGKSIDSIRIALTYADRNSK